MANHDPYTRTPDRPALAYVFSGFGLLMASIMLVTLAPLWIPLWIIGRVAAKFNIFLDVNSI